MAEIIAAKKTLYGGIRFKSRLEARFAEQLDDWHCHWHYEPELWLPKTYWKNKQGYRPDFWIEDLQLYVEIKPREFLGEFKVFFSDMMTYPVPFAIIDQVDRQNWEILWSNLAFGFDMLLGFPTPVRFEVIQPDLPDSGKDLVLYPPHITLHHGLADYRSDDA